VVGVEVDKVETRAFNFLVLNYFPWKTREKLIIFAFTLFRLEYISFSFSEYLIRGLLYVLLVVFF